MQRRDFLKKASIGAAAGAATTLAAPAIAAELPSIKWRLTSSFPKSLDTIYGGADVLANRLREMTGGKFDIRVFPGGEIVPGLQALDAVQQGTVEICHTCSYYYVGKDKTFGFGTSVPFGMNARQQNAWIYYGGGQKLLDEFYANYNVVSFAGGNTGTQMGGWWRKEVKTVADLKGIKMRIGGLGGAVLTLDPGGFGWRLIFLYEGLAGLLIVAGGLITLPDTGRSRAGFDGPGVLLFSLAILLVVVPLAIGRLAGWPMWIALPIAAALPVALDPGALAAGSLAAATVWTCDLSHDYVTINADYRS